MAENPGGRIFKSIAVGAVMGLVTELIKSDNGRTTFKGLVEAAALGGAVGVAGLAAGDIIDDMIGTPTDETGTDATASGNA